MEDILEPELAIVDPHHHLWDRTVGTFGRYDLAELQTDARAGHHVVKTVFVECGSRYRTDGPEHLKVVGETEWVASRAAASRDEAGPEIAAIVASADLTLGSAVDEVLDAHVEAAQGLFRGIRHRLAYDDHPVHPGYPQAPPHLATEPAFRAGVARLGARGFSFESWAFHPQLPEIIDLARACPGTLIVCNHLGGPLGVGPYTDRAAVLASWRPRMAELAGCANVVLKLGGIGMTDYGARWEKRRDSVTSEEITAYWGDEIRYCIDTFGPDRCMFESNFPVDSLSMGYAVLWNAFKRIAAGYSDAEKHDLFHATAARTYELS